MRAWSRSSRPRYRTTGPTAGRTSTARSSSVSGSGCARPGRSRAQARSTSSSTPAAPSAPALTRPPVSASSSCWSCRGRARREGPLTDLGTGSGAPRDRRREARLGPSLRLRPREALDRGSDCQRHRERRRRPPRAPATFARASPPLALDDRRQPDRPGPQGRRRPSSLGSRGRARRSLRAVAPASPPPVPEQVGLLGPPPRRAG